MSNASLNETFPNFQSFGNVPAITFTPVWNTASGQLLATTEAATVIVELNVADVYTTLQPAGTFVLWLGNANTANVGLVRVNGSPTAFTQNGDAIGFPILAQPAYLEVYASHTITYSLLSGDLPPGLILSQTGQISGTVGDIGSHSVEQYEFTIRASNGSHVRDRYFTISVQPVAQTPTFTLNLPVQNIPNTAINYQKIATLAHGDAFSYTLDIVDPDDNISDLVVGKITGLPSTGSYYSGLPAGLTLNGHDLSGVVSANATVGQFLFQVTSLSNQLLSKTLMIEISTTIASTIQLAPVITWTTASGSLGGLKCCDPCPFVVQATATGTGSDTLNYELSPISAPLPPGLVLDPTSGEIRGRIPYIAKSTIFSFTVRAVIGNTFKERMFWITALPRLNSPSYYDVVFRLRATERRAFLFNYAVMIDSASIYRPLDSNFGITVTPQIYIIGGLTHSADFNSAMSGTGLPAMTKPDFYDTVRLVLGDHAIVAVKDDSGVVLYDVLYRTLYDPYSKAGGFATQANPPVRQNVVYPLAKGTPSYVFQASVTNIRDDLALDVGFATSDPVQANLLGPTGVETMPVWMAGNYQIAIPIAYLRAGLGQAVLDYIEANKSQLIETGQVYTFEYIREISST